MDDTSLNSGILKHTDKRSVVTEKPRMHAITLGINAARQRSDGSDNARAFHFAGT
jgi:hypothetical protein